jgi:acetyl coenzyme A synthetase (ADP forming)-like protein
MMVPESNTLNQGPLVDFNPAAAPQFTCDVVLRDGTTVCIRSALRDEVQNLVEFYESLAAESIRLRFFSSAIDLVAEANRELEVDGLRVTLVATTGPAGRIIAHAMYVVPPESESAEVALAVADDWQGRGLGTLLLGELAVIAATYGIARFEAIVLPENLRMIETFQHSGFATETSFRDGQVLVTIQTALSPAVQREFDRRDQIAAANALTHILEPDSIAVIGASRQRGTVGGEIFHNLLAGEFTGPVYPINVRASVVQSVRAYPEIEAVADKIDLAVIAVPVEQVLEVARQCAVKGVRALVVLTAGFAEVGKEGRDLQQKLLELCRQFGIRMIGPNCFGVMNTNPAIRLNATFGPNAASTGRLALASQSGALGLAAITEASVRGLGISSFASMGNKADISGNDLLCYWEQDPRTDVILLYLESFGNPRKFARVASRVSLKKPIVAVKSGRSASGQRAAGSHTGVLLGASDSVVDALFERSGVIRTQTISELFDVAMLLADQPIPPGRRVAIVTNVGGPAILCADACEARGLTLPVLGESTQSQLRAMLSPAAAVSNPVDLLAEGTPDQYRAAIAAVAGDPGVDSVIALFLQPLSTGEKQIAAAMKEARAEMPPQKPLLAVLMGAGGTHAALRGADGSVPAFPYPESAASALAHAARYGELRIGDHQAPERFADLRPEQAQSVIAMALSREAGWLTFDEIASVLDAYGIRRVEQRQVADISSALQAARELGGPVALKAIVPGVTHKSDLGAVQLNLSTQSSVRRAAQQMTAHIESLEHSVAGFIVQTMAPSGAEMLVGAARDPQFGPVVLCGAGGTLVELVNDISARLAPLSRADARAMVRSLRSYPLLTGYRGSPVRDEGALEDILLRVGFLVNDIPEIVELDCNPVMVHEEGAVVVDARMRVAPPPPREFLGAR